MKCLICNKIFYSKEQFKKHLWENVALLRNKHNKAIDKIDGHTNHCIFCGGKLAAKDNEYCEGMVDFECEKCGWVY